MGEDGEMEFSLEKFMDPGMYICPVYSFQYHLLTILG